MVAKETCSEFNGGPHKRSVHILGPVNVHFGGERVFADIIKIKGLRGDYPGFSEGPQFPWWCSYKSEIEGDYPGRREGHVTKEAETWVMWPQVKEQPQPPAAGRSRRKSVPKPPKVRLLACERIHFHCFKPPVLWPPDRNCQLTGKNNPTKNRQKIWIDMFSKKTHRCTNRHMKRCSTSRIIREMQIKATMRHHFTPIRSAIIKKTRNNKYWRGCREREHLYTATGDTNWCSRYGKQPRGSSKY